MTRAERLAHRLGGGLVAGAAGTAAMTISSTAEMKLRGRPPSSAPRQVAERLLRVKAKDREGARLATVSHALLGTALGGVCGLLGIRRASGFFAVAMAPELVLVPAMGAASPPWRWGGGEIAISAGHHVAYAVAAAATARAVSL